MLTSAVAGDTEAVKVTAPPKPLVGDAATVNVVLLPALTGAEGGVAVIVKSPAAKAGTFNNRTAARVPHRTRYVRNEASFAGRDLYVTMAVVCCAAELFPFWIGRVEVIDWS